MAKLVSKVYGDALFEAAIESGQVDTLLEETSALIPIFKENSQLEGLLNNPQILKRERLTILEEIFSKQVSKELMSFLTIIVDKDRQKEMIPILEYFVQRIKEYKKIGVALVSSAVELKPQQKSDLEKKLLETTSYVVFEMEYLIDPTLVGGLVIRIGDRVIDSSVKTRLYNLKRELAKLQLA